MHAFSELTCCGSYEAASIYVMPVIYICNSHFTIYSIYPGQAVLIWQVAEVLETLMNNVAPFPHLKVAGEFGSSMFSNYVSLAIAVIITI